MGNIPETKVEDSKLIGPDDNPPDELGCKTPLPNDENTTADETVNDDPIFKLPDVVKVLKVE